MYQFSFLSILNLIVGLWIFLMGIFLFITRRQTYIYLTYFTTAGWILGYAFAHSSINQELSLFWCKIVYTSVIFIAPTMYHFVVVFWNFEKQKKIIWVSYIISLLFLYAIFFTPYFIKGVKPFSWGYHTAVNPPLHLIFLLFFSIVYSKGIFNLFKIYRKQKEEGLSLGVLRSRYFILIYLISFIGAIDYLQDYGLSQFYPVGFLFPGIGVTLAAYAILRHRLLDINIAITRAGIFLFVYAFVLGLPFYLGFKTGLWVWALVLMGILATVGPFFYRRLQRKAEDILLAKQKHYQKLLLQAATGMVREHNLDRLLKLIVHVVKRAVRIEFAAVFLEDRENNCYSLKTIRDCGVLPKELSFSDEHPVIKLVQQKRIPLSYEEIGPLFKGSFNKPIHLIVPCFIDDSLLGFLALGEKKDRTFYTQDDINIFAILSRQTALAVEYCMFLEEFKKGQEKIFTAEKLASIGGMASGVAHQIRNRLDVFGSHADKQRFKIEDFLKENPQLIAQNPEFKKILDYLIEEADGIENNVQRCGQLITGILKFAGTQQMEAGFSEFSLKEVIELCISPIKAKHTISGELPLDLEIELGNDDIIYASKGQMVEVMFNSIDNGYEAIEELRLYLSDEEKKKYKPFIKIELHKPGDSYIIKISDNGIGIKQENKLKIFSPYFTTKSSTISGTGIGMYVIKRIIEENHKGKIRFESTFRKGTTFFIELPKTNRMKR